MVKNEENSTDSEADLDRNDDKPSGCPHIAKSIDTTKLRKLLKSPGGLAKSCSECKKIDNESAEPPCEFEYEIDDTLWLCLRCGVQLCGRSVKKHALLHYEVSVPSP